MYSPARMKRVAVTGISATTTLARTKLADIADLPEQGVLEKIVLHITEISGSAEFVKLTIGTANLDRRYLIAASGTDYGTIGAWNVDADTATTATLALQLETGFVFDGTAKADTTNYTGIWLGLDLDAGTATVEAELIIRDK